MDHSLDKDGFWCPVKESPLSNPIALIGEDNYFFNQLITTPHHFSVGNALFADCEVF